MKRALLMSAVMAAVCLAAVPAAAVGPNPIKLGVGAYGITGIPIAQDDAKTGGMFGGRLRVGVLPILAFEGTYSQFNLGDGESDGITFAAPEEKSWAINAMLKSSGTGFGMYLTGGIGNTDIKIENGTPDDSATTYNFGIGAEFGLGPLFVDLSPRVYVIETADGVSRKNVAGMAGVTYYIF